MTAQIDMTIAPDSPLATLWCPSPNVEPRQNGLKPDMLLLHYTGMDSAEAALDWLTRQESGVSCHYLVDAEGRIAQMVPESERAWHAGQSLWQGETDINSCSIGIEIHNPGHDFDYPDFPDAEMRAVEALCRDILSRQLSCHCREKGVAHPGPGPVRQHEAGPGALRHLQQARDAACVVDGNFYRLVRCHRRARLPRDVSNRVCLVRRECTGGLTSPYRGRRAS